MGYSTGQLWDVKKGDSVVVNGLKLKVEKVDTIEAESEDEEQTKEIFLKGVKHGNGHEHASGEEQEYLIDLSDSLRTFYRMDKLDSYTTKKVEIPIETISPE